MSKETSVNGTDNIWQQRANTFWPGTTAMQMERLPPGIYAFRVDGFGSWFLERTAPKFTFPYKLYGQHNPILERVRTTWKRLEGNLGVLLNGIKGSGKTISAQVLANWAIEQEGIPVLAVQSPIPTLAEVLGKVEQHVMVVFDEFEKTHEDKDDQQRLLTAIDGMARSEYKRLFVFTTNEKIVNDNFLDRPSRIRYCWEFGRLADAVVEDLLKDLLDPELNHLRPAILDYLGMRRVLSIDVVKTVIGEVNIYRDSPASFSEALNLSEQEARGFKLELLDSNRNPVRTISSYFSPDVGDRNLIRSALTRSGRQKFIDVLDAGRGVYVFDQYTHMGLNFLSATDDPNEWVCHLGLPHRDTWVGKYPRVEKLHEDESNWVDEKPKGWRVPDWAVKMQERELTPEEYKESQKWADSDTIFGTGVKAPLLIRITPNYVAREIRFGDFAAF